MSNAGSAKCSCQVCGQHFEFPLTAANTVIVCPQCHQPTRLTVPTADLSSAESPPARSAFTATDLAAAFGGPVRRTSASILYQAALLLVSSAMVLLPLLYIALVG